MVPPNSEEEMAMIRLKWALTLEIAEERAKTTEDDTENAAEKCN